jgi:hypothetical protein
MKKKSNFEEAFEIQKSFTKKLFLEKYGIDIEHFTDEEKLKWSKEYILSASKELYEMLDELPKWKTHRFITEDDNLDNFAEEGIDAFKFLLNLFIVNGLSSDDFWTKFLEKSVVVDIRYEQDKKLQEAINSDRKFVVFDIDGILNDYPKNIIRYFKYLECGYDSIEEFKANDLKKYNALKNQFRISGEERNCKPIIENIEFMRKCKEAGYGIILLTARPYYKITRLFFDTIHWLTENQIDYDFLFFSKNKEEYLMKSFNKEQIHFVIDDQIDNANKLAYSFTTYLLPNRELYKTNSDLDYVNNSVKIINSVNEIEL